VTSRITAHFRDILGEVKGQLYEWDVVNEPYTNYDLQGRPTFGVGGLDPIAGVLPFNSLMSWLSLARSLDNKTRLYINDYDVLEGYQQGHALWAAGLLRYLVQNKAQLDGFGLQGHFGQMIKSFFDLDARLALLTPFNLPLAITEFDVDVSDLQLQADYTADFTTWAFSQPAITEFLMWGFWARRHWMPNAALYTTDWQLKPNGRAFRDLVLKTWWSYVTANTNAAGDVTSRVFKGDYVVQVFTGGVLRKQQAFSVRSDMVLRVQLP